MKGTQDFEILEIPFSKVYSFTLHPFPQSKNPSRNERKNPKRPFSETKTVSIITEIKIDIRELLEMIDQDSWKIEKITIINEKKKEIEYMRPVG